MNTQNGKCFSPRTRLPRVSCHRNCSRTNMPSTLTTMTTTSMMMAPPTRMTHPIAAVLYQPTSKLQPFSQLRFPRPLHPSHLRRKYPPDTNVLSRHWRTQKQEAVQPWLALWPPTLPQNSLNLFKPSSPQQRLHCPSQPPSCWISSAVSGWPPPMTNLAEQVLLPLLVQHRSVQRPARVVVVHWRALSAIRTTRAPAVARAAVRADVTVAR